MPRQKPITFKGKKYETVHSLVDAWNIEHSPIFPATYRSTYEILLRWKKKHPGRKLTDEAIEKALTPQAARSAIQYRGEWYKGPTSLYKVLEDIAELPAIRFAAKLREWKKENPDRKPTDEEIEGFTKRLLSQTDDGRFIGPLHLMWEEIPEPKLDWDFVRQKVYEFRNNTGRGLRRELSRTLTQQMGV
ncbi:MAG: hypothetical protein HKM90_04515 [Desulfobacteraceae bacterium]|jgi:hypothetical protein|nr:hypothetical protein [Desulfobacteraceae bacterium]